MVPVRRKHLATPVSKTGSASPRSEHYPVAVCNGGRLQRPFRQTNPQPIGNHHDHQHLFPKVAGTKIGQTAAAAEQSSANEDEAAAADAAKRQTADGSLFGTMTARLANESRSVGNRLTTHPNSTKGNPMLYTPRYQRPLLFRKSYKPNRVIRIRPAAKLVFRPRAGPPIKIR